MSNESNESNNDTCISKGKDKNMGYVLIQGKYWANREAAVQRQGLHRVCPHVEARRAPPLHRPPKRLLRPQVLTRRGRRRLLRLLILCPAPLRQCVSPRRLK